MFFERNIMILNMLLLMYGVLSNIDDNIGVWCNGSTTDFDSVSRGSNPLTPTCFCVSFMFTMLILKYAYIVKYNHIVYDNYCDNNYYVYITVILIDLFYRSP